MPMICRAARWSLSTLNKITRAKFQSLSGVLKFVGLERVFRASDFFAVQDVVEEIRTYTSKMGKPYLLVFAYMYLRFSDATPCYTHLPETTDTEKVRRTFDYLGAITSEKRLIGDWARILYDRYSPSFFKALHRKT